MITTINSRYRVFQLVSENNTQAFCNLENFAEVYNATNPVKIYHFWNCKQTKIRLRYVNEMLQAAGLGTVAQRGYTISFNTMWNTWQVGHPEAGATIAGFKTYKAALAHCLAG